MKDILWFSFCWYGWSRQDPETENYRYKSRFKAAKCAIPYLQRYFFLNKKHVQFFVIFKQRETGVL